MTGVNFVASFKQDVARNSMHGHCAHRKESMFCPVDWRLTQLSLELCDFFLTALAGALQRLASGFSYGKCPTRAWGSGARAHTAQRRASTQCSTTQHDENKPKASEPERCTDALATSAHAPNPLLACRCREPHVHAVPVFGNRALPTCVLLVETRRSACLAASGTLVWTYVNTCLRAPLVAFRIRPALEEVHGHTPF